MQPFYTYNNSSPQFENRENQKLSSPKQKFNILSQEEREKNCIMQNKLKSQLKQEYKPHLEYALLKLKFEEITSCYQFVKDQWLQDQKEIQEKNTRITFLEQEL